MIMNETRTEYRWFFAWDFEKEEEWLNEMAEAGWVLSSVGFCRYTFERCEPGEYTVRLQMLNRDSDYIRFIEDIGGEYIGRMAQWVYFRRRTELGAFELFSDIDSRITHLETIARVLFWIGIGNLLIGIGNSLNRFPFAFINLIVACLLMYGLGRIHGKIDDLKSERRLHE